jgi:hexosaminidase
MVFPRVLAAAERAWHRADWENDYKVGVEYSQNSNLVDKASLNQDYNRFANVLGQRELAKLEKSGIDYRLPVPGAKVEDGKLAMNVQFPGVTLQYSLDGENWLTYADNARPNVTGEVFIRSVSATGEKVSRITSVK